MQSSTDDTKGRQFSEHAAVLAMELWRLPPVSLLLWLCAVAAGTKPLSVVITSFPSAGHVTPAANLGEELVRRGHAVTLCTTEAEGSSDLARKKAEAAGMTFLSAGNSSVSISQMQDVFEKQGVENKSTADVYAMFREGMKALNWVPDISNAIGKVLDNENFSSYDIMISTEFLAPMAACISRKWNAPAVILSTTLQFQSEHLPPWPFPPHYINKRGTLHTSDDMTFLRRFLSVLFKPLLHLTLDLMFVRFAVNRFEFECTNSTYSYLKYFPGTNAPQIVPTVIGFEYPRLMSSLTHYVGPVLSKRPQTIPSDLQEWLDDKPEKGVILISMGSLAPLTKTRGHIIVESILSTNYSAVWSLRERNRFILDELEIDTNRFYISKWIPQAAILSHPATAMAFLHGGMNGINEALSCGVPVIVMPFSSDQGDVSARVQHSGAGVQILKEHLSKDSLTAAIRDIRDGRLLTVAWQVYIVGTIILL